MSLFSADTHPQVFGVLVQGYRAMTPAQKIARVVDLSDAARTMATARIRRQYPEATDRELRLRLAALTLGRETMVRVFSWDPVESGW